MQSGGEWGAVGGWANGVCVCVCVWGGDEGGPLLQRPHLALSVARSLKIAKRNKRSQRENGVWSPRIARWKCHQNCRCAYGKRGWDAFEVAVHQVDIYRYIYNVAATSGIGGC